MLASGDDAAIAEREGATATSVDALVDGVHFRRGELSPAEIGAKALAVALSDLAAMAAEPREAYVQLGLPSDLGADAALELADGLGAVAAAHGVAIAGGDVTRAPVLFVALTVVGVAESAAAMVRRAGATAGDRLVVTGELGGAAAGLLVLERPELGAANDEPTNAALRTRQAAPEPRIEAGRLLARAGARAMIDLSDGLGGDAAHLAAASAVALRIELEAVPIQAGVEAVAAAAGLDPEELASGGGEDYELLAALPVERLDEVVAEAGRAGIRLTAIGSVAAGEGVELRRRDGELLAPAGFDHLGAARAPGDRP